jgi:hypothetical protein
MNNDLDKVLDSCIDRMNRGESLDDCLRSYPEHVKELEPLLRALSEARDASSSVPRASARLAARQRLDAALLKAERGRQKPQRRTIPLFGGSRAWVTVPIVLLLAAIGFGLYWGLTPGSAQANFAMLVSDEANAIGDFKRLEVTISSIGVLRVGESDSWEVIKLYPSVVVDLTRLQGLNAEEIWSGHLPDGQYMRVFIDIKDTIGILKSGEIANITAPSVRMEISKPFAVTADGSKVSFVCDVTVMGGGTGQDGDKYVLQPQVNESGANQNFHEVGEGELTLQVVNGQVAPGGNVTVSVTSEGNSSVPDAWVYVNDKKVGQTSADGTIRFIVPNEQELEIRAVKGESEGELTIDLQRESHQQQGEGENPPANGQIALGNDTEF